MEIRVRLTKEQAIERINEIKNKICEVDLDELCKDEAKIENKDERTSQIYEKVIQGVRCGLVDWDETENCMVQHLIHPLKAGDMNADKLFYKNNVKFGDSKDFRSSQEGEVMIQTLSNITGKATQLIEELRGQDLLIAIGCMGFFDR